MSIDVTKAWWFMGGGSLPLALAPTPMGGAYSTYKVIHSRKGIYYGILLNSNF